MFKLSAHVIVLASFMAHLEAARFTSCCTMPSTLKCQGASGGGTCTSRLRPVISSSVAFDTYAPSGSSRTSLGLGRSRIQPSISACQHSPVLLLLVSLCGVPSKTLTMSCPRQVAPATGCGCTTHFAKCVKTRQQKPRLSYHQTLMISQSPSASMSLDFV